MLKKEVRVKRLRLKILPRDGWFHPLDKAYQETPRAQRESILEMNLSDDGMVIALLEISGEPEVVKDIGETGETGEWVRSYHVFEYDDRMLVYVQFEPNNLIHAWLEAQRLHNVIYEHPSEFTTEGGLVLTVVGEMENLQNTVEYLEIGSIIEVLQITDYWSRDERLFYSLSERQRETLQVALELGYYESPRQATQKDIARVLDRTHGTVGEHLQKIESSVLHKIYPS